MKIEPKVFYVVGGLVVLAVILGISGKYPQFLRGQLLTGTLGNLATQHTAQLALGGTQPLVCKPETKYHDEKTPKDIIISTIGGPTLDDAKKRANDLFEIQLNEVCQEIAFTKPYGPIHFSCDPSDRCHVRVGSLRKGYFSTTEVKPVVNIEPQDTYGTYPITLTFPKNSVIKCGYEPTICDPIPKCDGEAVANRPGIFQQSTTIDLPENRDDRNGREQGPLIRSSDRYYSLSELRALAESQVRERVLERLAAQCRAKLAEQKCAPTGQCVLNALPTATIENYRFDVIGELEEVLTGDIVTSYWVPYYARAECKLSAECKLVD